MEIVWTKCGVGGGHTRLPTGTRVGTVLLIAEREVVR